MIDTFDLEVIADKISDKCYEKMFKVPDEFRQMVRKSYICTFTTILCENPGDYLTMETYITDIGGVILRFRTGDGRTIMERALA
jgi:hypothetical protein